MPAWTRHAEIEPRQAIASATRGSHLRSLALPCGSLVLMAVALFNEPWRHMLFEHAGLVAILIAFAATASIAIGVVAHRSLARRLRTPITILTAHIDALQDELIDPPPIFDAAPPLTEIAELIRHGRRYAEFVAKQERYQLRLRAELERVLAGREAEILRRTAEIEQHSRDLEEAVATAQSASRAKTAFLATMSHELRTPLTSIIGFSDRLSHHVTNAKDQRAAVLVHSAAKHMLGLVSDLLDVARIESGRFSLALGEFDPAQLLRDVITIQRPPIEEKGLALTVPTELSLPMLLHGDPVRVRQILLNLLGNALKFTERGGITLKVCADRSRRTLRFEVHDTGPGILPEQREHLFQPFNQADAGIARQYGGTGVGLYLSHELALRMGCELDFESTPGRGSNFWLGVPIPVDQIDGPWQAFVFERRRSPRSRQHRPPRLKGRVLVVEDSPSNRELLELYLGDSGLDASFASDGEAGVQAYLAGEFDLILMDVHMPKVSGLDATILIRMQDSEIPILALTADLTAQGLQDQRDAGFNETIAKPIDPEVLTHALLRYLPELKDADAAILSSKRDDTVDQLAKLRTRFIANLELEYVAPLRQGFEAHDWGSVQNLAHRLYGAAGSYGLSPIAKSARDLELYLGKTPEPDRIRIDALLDVALAATAAAQLNARPEPS